MWKAVLVFAKSPPLNTAGLPMMVPRQSASSWVTLQHVTTA